MLPKFEQTRTEIQEGLAVCSYLGWAAAVLSAGLGCIPARVKLSVLVVGNALVTGHVGLSMELMEVWWLACSNLHIQSSWPVTECARRHCIGMRVEIISRKRRDG